VAEWLTHPPGREPAPALAARVADLTTEKYRDVIVGLSTAGTDDRPGALAVMGATTAVRPERPATLVFRVTAWQALYGASSELIGPDSWDVTLVADPDGGWRVDGLRRAV
jgi:hypothetical protein